MDLLQRIEDKADEISTKLYGMRFSSLDNDRQLHVYSLANLDIIDNIDYLNS